MASVWITQWSQFTETGAISGPTVNYGGATDWLKYWADQTHGVVALTEFFAALRNAPGINLETRVAVTRANDLPLLEQDLNSIQISDYLLYPGTQRNKAAVAPPALSWNGFAWVNTDGDAGQGWSSTPVASFGGANVPNDD